MNYKKLKFSDIMQSKILYYDEEVEDACYNICEELKIDNMPDYDSKHYYELVNGSFEKKVIQDNLKLKTTDVIFDKACIEKFQNNDHNVLFVFEGNILKGIVHFSDYNRNIVLKRIQDDVLNFEFNLREFLILNDRSNTDILSFFEYRKKKASGQRDKNHWSDKVLRFEKKTNQMKNLGQFQLFNLTDLMFYCKSSRSKRLFEFDPHPLDKNKDESDIIGSLRNLAMHGKNPVEKDLDSGIFSIESLKYFTESLKVLKKYNSELVEKIYNNEDFLRSVKLENQNKLRIIHEHHPKALKYFVGNQ